MKRRITHLLVLLSVLLCADGWALDPSEVKDYGEVFAIEAVATAPDFVEISWKISPNYYLYHNQFLEFSSNSPGVVVGVPLIPEGERKFDELLGEEVIKFKDHLTIGLPLKTIPVGTSLVEITIQSQGCLEGVLCYPPSKQSVAVSLPAVRESFDADTDLLSQMLSPTQAGVMQDQAAGAPALQPEEAFSYEAIAFNEETIMARFTAQPGYYLYVDKFEFEIAGAPGFEIRAVDLPKGTIKDDPEFGPVPVIYDQVEIPIHLNRPAGGEQALTLQAAFQGCRDGDICYPPQTGRIDVVMSASGAAVEQEVVVPAQPPRPDVLPPLTEQDRLAKMLQDHPLAAMFVFFGLGVLLAFTPCVFPMIPILSGIIAGEGDSITTSRAFWLSLIYVLAMAVTYTIAGVLAGLFGKNLQAMFQEPWIIVSFVTIFIALAMSMFGFYELQLPSSWQTKLTEQSNRLQGGKLSGVAVMGFLSALIVGPCVAPPLAGALIYLGSTGSPVIGGGALFSMSMGMGVPLIAFGVSAGRFLPSAGPWMNAVKAVFGVGLLALAIWMLERILPGAVIMVLWGVLAITSAVYLGALDQIPEGASGWKKLWKSFGVILLLAGAIQLFGAASGGDYWLKPLDHLQGNATSSHPGSAQEHVEFRPVKSLQDLGQAVAEANALGQPAMLDFYADWCVECIRMEKNTFPDPAIQALLGQIQPLQADVTDHDETDQALMAKYGVIGPPAILFFNRQGEEMKAYRLVGYFTPEQFGAHLKRVMEGS